MSRLGAQTNGSVFATFILCLDLQAGLQASVPEPSSILPSSHLDTSLCPV